MKTVNDSALLLGVSAAEALIGEHRARLDPSELRGVRPHVTALYPFMSSEASDPCFGCDA